MLTVGRRPRCNEIGIAAHVGKMRGPHKLPGVQGYLWRNMWAGYEYIGVAGNTEVTPVGTTFANAQTNISLATARSHVFSASPARLGQVSNSLIMALVL